MAYSATANSANIIESPGKLLHLLLANTLITAIKGAARRSARFVWACLIYQALGEMHSGVYPAGRRRPQLCIFKEAMLVTCVDLNARAKIVAKMRPDGGTIQTAALGLSMPAMLCPRSDGGHF